MAQSIRIEVITLGRGYTENGSPLNVVKSVLGSFEMAVSTTATTQENRPNLASVMPAGAAVATVRLTAEGDEPVYVQRVTGSSVASATPPAPSLKLLVDVPEIFEVDVAGGEGLSFVSKV